MTSTSGTFMRAAVIAPAAIFSALILASCSDAVETPASSPATEKRVVIEGIAFEPKEITVGVGETVTWLNEDDVDHTVTSGTPGKQGIPGVKEGTEPKLDGLFDEALPEQGSTFSFTFDERGTYSYFCEIHASMRAVITVQ